MAETKTNFKPFVAAETKMAEFTVKSIITGSIFGIIFGASTVYLALKAGLTVSASMFNTGFPDRFKICNSKWKIRTVLRSSCIARRNKQFGALFTLR